MSVNESDARFPVEGQAVPRSLDGYSLRYLFRHVAGQFLRTAPRR